MKSFGGRTYLQCPAFDAKSLTLIQDMGDYITNSTKKGWLTSIFELGAWLGCLYSGFLSEALSRKYAIIVNVGVFVIGVVVQTTSIKAGHSAILGGRFVTGMLLYYFLALGYLP